MPFVFAANGRSYLKQVETESGIWFRDTRRSANHRRALVNWLTPRCLSGLLEVDQDAADAALKSTPFGLRLPPTPLSGGGNSTPSKRPCRRNSDLCWLRWRQAPARHKLAIALLFRLLSAKRFRRICFVVDRSALGHQTEGEFSTTKVVSGKTFAEIFGLKGLGDVSPDVETKVHICTIQRACEACPVRCGHVRGTLRRSVRPYGHRRMPPWLPARPGDVRCRTLVPGTGRLHLQNTGGCWSILTR